MMASSSKKPPHEQSKPITFYPTLEELASFDKYVAYMEFKGAHKAGIAKIVPPKNWTARKIGYDPAEMNIKIENPVKQNIAVTKVPGAFITYADQSLPPLTIPEYLRLANSPKYLPPSHSSYEELEQLYWQQNTEDNLYLPSPIYGGEVQGTLTDMDQAVFNLSKLPSILTGMNEKIPGVNLPHLYVGMWKATSSWHVEDMDLYAVHYLHYGAPKTWYCVPPQFGYKLEQVAQKLFPEMSGTCFNLLRHKDILIRPKLLATNGIPVINVVQEQGTIMGIFPHAFHSGFNHAFNMAEGINFALPRWVEYGKRFRDCLCSKQKSAVRVNMDQFVKKFQPEMFSNWKQGEDFALHPEDPEFVKRYWEDLKTRFHLGFINNKEFESLRKSLRSKREVDVWFKEKFPNLDYNDYFELVVDNERSEETAVDSNCKKIPGLNIPVQNLKKRDYLVKMKSKEKMTTNKHLKKELKAHKALLDQQRKDFEAKKVNKKSIGNAGKGFGFKGAKFEDLKSKQSLVQCSANKKHKFKACKKCSGCTEANCETCVYCLDNPRNGGKLVLKQKCKKRICVNPVMGTCVMCKLDT